MIEPPLGLDQDIPHPGRRSRTCRESQQLGQPGVIRIVGGIDVLGRGEAPAMLLRYAWVAMTLRPAVALRT
jgi:hypothetical protein